MRKHLKPLILLCLVGILWLAGGCQRRVDSMSTDGSADAQLAEQTQSTPTTVALNAPRYTELLLWVPPFMASPHPAGAVLEEAMNHFAKKKVDLVVTAHPKAETGRAGLLSFLMSAERVAPGLLPDIIVLEEQDLWQAVDLDLIVPLSEEEVKVFNLPASVLDAATYDGEIYGLPYAFDLEHLVYRQDQIEQAPATWQELLAKGEPYLFAAGSPDGRNSDFLVGQYLGAGGSVNNAGDLTTPEALDAVFTVLKEASAQGLIPATALTLASSDAVWALFNSGDVALAHIPASLYAANRAGVSGTAYAPMPTLDGKPLSVKRAWNFAIVTRDPQQRLLALGLLADLFRPNVQGEWSESAYLLPTQEAAFALWDQDDPYTTFLVGLLQHAVTLPKGKPFAEFVRSLHHAERALLNDDALPQEVLSGFPDTP